MLCVYMKLAGSVRLNCSDSFEFREGKKFYKESSKNQREILTFSYAACISISDTIFPLRT